MRYASIALAALLLAGCAHPVAPARTAAGAWGPPTHGFAVAPGVRTVTAQAGTLELRRAIRARFMLAFTWADADGDEILVFGEAARLGMGADEFRGRDKDSNGALSFTELQGATEVSEEVHRLRQLSVDVTDPDADKLLTEAEYAKAAFGVAPQVFTPNPDGQAKAKLFGLGDRNADGRLDRAELEGLFGLATERGYLITAGR